MGVGGGCGVGQEPVVGWGQSACGMKGWRRTVGQRGTVGWSCGRSITARERGRPAKHRLVKLASQNGQPAHGIIIPHHPARTQLHRTRRPAECRASCLAVPVRLPPPRPPRPPRLPSPQFPPALWLSVSTSTPTWAIPCSSVAGSTPSLPT